MADKWSGIERPSAGSHRTESSPGTAGIEDFGDAVNIKNHTYANTKANQESSAATGLRESSGSDKERVSKNQDQQVVLRLTVRVAKDQAVTTIEELRKAARADVSFEVPQSSLPISGIVKWDRQVVGSRVQKWVAVTAEG